MSPAVTRSTTGTYDRDERVGGITDASRHDRVAVGLKRHAATNAVTRAVRDVARILLKLHRLAALKAVSSEPSNVEPRRAQAVTGVVGPVHRISTPLSGRP